MTAAQTAAEIRGDMFRQPGQNVITPPTLAAAARVLAAGLAARVDRILADKPWYWRLLFGRGLRFAVAVLDQVAAQIAGDYQMT